MTHGLIGKIPTVEITNHDGNHPGKDYCVQTRHEITVHIDMNIKKHTYKNMIQPFVRAAPM